jgi:hypothetical protein
MPLSKDKTPPHQRWVWHVSLSAGSPVVQPKDRHIASRISRARHLANSDGGLQKSDSNHRASGMTTSAKRPTNLSNCSDRKQSSTKWVATRSNSRDGGVHFKMSAWTNGMPSTPNPAASNPAFARFNIRALALAVGETVSNVMTLSAPLMPGTYSIRLGCSLAGVTNRPLGSGFEPSFSFGLLNVK